MLSYHSYSCAQRTWGCVAYRGIWDRVTHCVAWKAVSNVSWVYGLIHLTHSCIPVYSICSAHSPPHICLQCSFYIAPVHRSKQYKCNELHGWGSRDTLHGVSAINWLRHGNEYNEKSEFFYNYKFSFFCERESFTLVALSLASVYLVVLFSTWGTRFKLQSERLLSSSLSLSMCRWNSPLSQSADTFDSSPVFPLGSPLSVWASASQQPVTWENVKEEEREERERWYQSVW